MLLYWCHHTINSYFTAASPQHSQMEVVVQISVAFSTESLHLAPNMLDLVLLASWFIAPLKTKIKRFKYLGIHDQWIFFRICYDCGYKHVVPYASIMLTAHILRRRDAWHGFASKLWSNTTLGLPLTMKSESVKVLLHAAVPSPVPSLTLGVLCW